MKYAELTDKMNRWENWLMDQPALIALPIMMTVITIFVAIIGLIIFLVISLFGSCPEFEVC